MFTSLKSVNKLWFSVCLQLDLVSEKIEKNNLKKKTIEISTREKQKKNEELITDEITSKPYSTLL